MEIRRDFLTTFKDFFFFFKMFNLRITIFVVDLTVCLLLSPFKICFVWQSVFHDKFSEKFGYFCFSEQQIAKLQYLSYHAALLIAGSQHDTTSISERIVKTQVNVGALSFHYVLLFCLNCNSVVWEKNAHFSEVWVIALKEIFGSRWVHLVLCFGKYWMLSFFPLWLC